ncbi:hypothetical protein AMJ49_05550 [Parcubacteria bacterium DG_74_2]|nr:MAG: hypothetical protein AMJ49_05550 [Parcubacteria bacterium DG_74_2]
MKKIIRYVQLFIGIFLMFLGSLIIFIVNKITKVKGKPSNYNKDRSIGVFVPHFNENGQRDCKEIARGTITSRGDIYVLPNLKYQKEFPFHESFHKSGRHHWKDGNKYCYPLAFNGNGLSASEKFVNFVAKPQYCFCFRRGKRLKDEEIKPLVEKLKRYVPPVDSEEVVSGLKKRGIFQAKHPRFLKDLWTRWKILSGKEK